MAKNHVDRIQQALRTVKGAMQYTDIRLGYLGKTGGINPSDGLDEPFVWVRFSPDGEAVRAWGQNTSRRVQDFPVSVGRNTLNGGWTIIEPIPSEGGGSEHLVATFGVPDRNPDYIYEEFDANRYKNLHVEPGATAFDVYVEPGLYWFQGEMKAWAGGTVNISTSQPTAGFGGSKRGVLIGINPVTDALTTYDGTVLGLLETPGAEGKYFTETYIATTVNAADPDMYWIALIPITSLDTNWSSLYRVTALTLTTGSGVAASAGTVRVTVNDLTADYLSTKLVAGTGVTLTVLNPAATETLSVALDTTYTDGRYVNITGDNMTGRLGIQAALTNLIPEGLENITTRTLTADTSGGVGVRIAHTLDQAGFNHTSGWNALRATASVTGASGTVAFASGAVVGVAKSGAGTLTAAYGLQVISASNSGGGTLTTNYGVKVESQTVATTNYAYYSDAGLNRLGDQLSVVGSADRVQMIVRANGTQINYIQEWQNASGTGMSQILPLGGLRIAQVAQATPGLTDRSMTVVSAAHTALTTATERPEVIFNLSATQEFAAGALALQRALRILAPTYSFTSASTITNAVTVDIDDAPLVGTNATLTNRIALRVGNRVQINGTLDIVPPASTGTPKNPILLTAPAHTALNAIEQIDVHLNLARNVQFTTGGSMANQRAIYIDRPTYTATSATQTIVDATTMYLVGPPVASTNVSITNSRTLWVASGVTRLDGQVQINELVVMGEARNFQFGTTTGTKIGTGTSQKMALWDKTPIVRPTALTTALTTVTFTAPGAADYSMTDPAVGGLGFNNLNEARTLFSVIANLQTRVNELETRLSNFGFLP